MKVVCTNIRKINHGFVLPAKPEKYSGEVKGFLPLNRPCQFFPEVITIVFKLMAHFGQRNEEHNC